MWNRSTRGFVIVLLAVAALAMVGVYSYNAGVAHGLAESARAVASASGDAAPRVVVWHRPWGYGYGFFPFFPFFFVLFWFIVVRALFWRGGWWGGHRYGYYGRGVPPAFEEWHRRAHAQQEPGKPDSV